MNFLHFSHLVHFKCNIIIQICHFHRKKKKVILITVIEPVMYMAYCVPESPIICLHALLEEFNQRVF